MPDHSVGADFFPGAAKRGGPYDRVDAARIDLPLAPPPAPAPDAPPAPAPAPMAGAEDNGTAPVNKPESSYTAVVVAALLAVFVWLQLSV